MFEQNSSGGNVLSVHSLFIGYDYFSSKQVYKYYWSRMFLGEH